MSTLNVVNMFTGRLAKILLGGLLLIPAACVHMEEKEPEHHIIMEHQLHSGMHTMAEHLNTIASLAFDDSKSEEEKTSTVLSKLEKINSIANEIASPGEVTNYSVINRYMNAFIYDVNVAEQFARRTPPNHFPAYTLVKSCLSCHNSI